MQFRCYFGPIGLMYSRTSLLCIEGNVDDLRVIVGLLKRDLYKVLAYTLYCKESRLILSLLEVKGGTLEAYPR